MYKKEYKCCRCHKVLTKKPIRLVKQVYDNKEFYGRYLNMHNYNFCVECYKVFDKWVKSYEL